MDRLQSTIVTAPTSPSMVMRWPLRRRSVATPARTYTLTVTASVTSGSTTLQHNVTLTLTVD
jgi:hypothetical protein